MVLFLGVKSSLACTKTLLKKETLEPAEKDDNSNFWKPALSLKHKERQLTQQLQAAPFKHIAYKSLTTTILFKW